MAWTEMSYNQFIRPDIYEQEVWDIDLSDDEYRELAEEKGDE